ELGGHHDDAQVRDRALEARMPEYGIEETGGERSVSPPALGGRRVGLLLHFCVEICRSPRTDFLPCPLLRSVLPCGERERVARLGRGGVRWRRSAEREKRSTEPDDRDQQTCEHPAR